MKKFFKILGIAILIIVMIPVITFIYFWVSNIIFMDGTHKENLAYLENNRTEISKTEFDENGIDHLFEAPFYDNNIFLLGEMHGFADVQHIDRSMLIHLNKKIGVRHYIAEMDSLRAQQLNTFLTGTKKDSLLLKQVVTDIALRIPQQSSQELYVKWSKLYDYNQDLDDSLKINVIGIDTNFDNIGATIPRDSAMYENFKNAITTAGLENEKFYGFFGFSHVLQSGFSSRNKQSFAAILKSSGLAIGKNMKSIVCHSLDSEARLPENDQFPAPPDEKTSLLNSDGPVIMVNGIEELRELSKENSITLFNLDKENSPYNQNQRLAKLKVNLMGEDIFPHHEAASTTNFFQYVFLIRNSEALHKLE